MLPLIWAAAPKGLFSRKGDPSTAGDPSTGGGRLSGELMTTCAGVPRGLHPRIPGPTCLLAVLCGILALSWPRAQ